ncbi:MAG: glycosyltransferase family 2 protein [Synechococcales cyanobacterium M58_A2018_015]|nr:glycosyltransferase family 2 protein [Synechococcales cyanobacterium M58_A2018_015]
MDDPVNPVLPKGAVDFDLSVVVPCFNEQDVLESLYQRLTQVCQDCVGDRYEILLIDDGSSDLTWPLIKRLTQRDAHIIGVNLSRNHGHQLALTAGLFLCRGQRVFIIDADLQDPPELLTAMMEQMDNGADVVYGKRIRREGETWFKKTTASLFYRLLNWMTDVEIPVDTGDFRLMDRNVVEVLRAMPEQYRFIRGMVAWAGFNQVEIPYERAARQAGMTKYPLKKMINFALDAITGFSIFPLRISTYLAIISLMLSIGLVLYVLYSWIFLDAAKGWTSLMAIILVFNSMQMWLLGIIGEYLGRTYLQTKNRPLFIVREIASSAWPIHDIHSINRPTPYSTHTRNAGR